MVYLVCLALLDLFGLFVFFFLFKVLLYIFFNESYDTIKLLRWDQNVEMGPFQALTSMHSDNK